MSTLALCSLEVTVLPDFLSYILGEHSLLYSFFFFPSLLVSRQWQCNDLYPTSIFILNPKGERNWYYWVTIPSHFHALHTKFSRQLCKTALLSSFLVRKHTLKGGKLAKVILLGRMYSSQDVLVVSCWGLLHPDTKGKEWVSKRLSNCPGMESDLGQTAQIIKAHPSSQNRHAHRLQTYSWFCYPIHYHCAFTIYLILSPQKTRALLIMFPLRWAVTNWKCGR